MARVTPSPVLNTNTNNTTTNNILFLSFTSKPTLSNTRTPHSLLSLKPSSLSLSFSSGPLLQRVSTSAVEFAPPAPEFDFHEELTRLRNLRNRLSRADSISDKLSVIENDSRVKTFLAKDKDCDVRVLRRLSKEDEFLVKCLVAAGQGHVLGSWERRAGEEDFGRSAVTSGLHMLVQMIEGMDVANDNGDANCNGGADKSEEVEFEVGELRRLVKMLGEVECFYDCLGGIIG